AARPAPAPPRPRACAAPPPPARGPPRDPDPEEAVRPLHQPERRDAARRARPRRDPPLRRGDRHLRRRGRPCTAPPRPPPCFRRGCGAWRGRFAGRRLHRRLARGRRPLHDGRGSSCVTRLRDATVAADERLRMVGHWFHAAADFATTWLPLAFFVVIALTAWLLWRTAGMMPRVKPANM